jgi:thioredoxin 1
LQFKELSEGFSDVVFVKVDVDDNPDSKYMIGNTQSAQGFWSLLCSAAAKYNVSAMPTFIFLKHGEVVDRLMGASPSRLQELIEEHK